MSDLLIRRWDEWCRYVKIGHIMVDQSLGMDDRKPKAPTINWSAIGSVTIERAQEALEDMMLAVEFARDLDKHGRNPATWTHVSAKVKTFRFADRWDLYFEGNR